MKIGSIVTILVDYPYGVEEESQNYVKGMTGVVVERDEEEENLFAVRIYPGEWLQWWFSEDEMRPATNEEIAEKLRQVMMPRWTKT